MKYTYRNRRKIKGWLSEIDNTIIEIILVHQNKIDIRGGTAEIGLHHGKSFIPLCLHLKTGERAYGIDLFENQRLNFDASGNGSKDRVIKNLARFGIEQDSYVLDGRSSDQVKSQDIQELAGKIRFFSIDGGHWEEIVENDLNLASELLIDGGVIAIDDYLRPDWPGVASGFHAWYLANKSEYQIFAIGFNKAYLCKPNYTSMYQHELNKCEFLSYMKRKEYEMDKVSVPVYFNFFLPEWTLKARIYGYFQLFHPYLFHNFKICKRRITQKNRIRPKR
jgi:Methyltransferase domain